MDWLAALIKEQGLESGDRLIPLLGEAWLTHMQQRAPEVYCLQTGRRLTCGDHTHFTGLKNGTEVTIGDCRQSMTSRHVTYSLSWLTSNGVRKSMDNLPLPKACKPTSENDQRFIYFVPEGIVITDQNRSAIDTPIIDPRSRQLGFKAPPVYPTLPLALMALSLQSHPFGRDFLNLWEHRSGTTVNAVLNGAGALCRANKEMKAIPREYFTSGLARALPLCTTYSGSAKTAVWNLLPIYPGDALWLMHRFLDAEYAHGGLVRCTNPAKDSTGNSVFSKLTT